MPASSSTRATFDRMPNISIPAASIISSSQYIDLDLDDELLTTNWFDMTTQTILSSKRKVEDVATDSDDTCVANPPKRRRCNADLVNVSYSKSTLPRITHTIPPRHVKRARIARTTPKLAAPVPSTADSSTFAFSFTLASAPAPVPASTPSTASTTPSTPSSPSRASRVAKHAQYPAYRRARSAPRMVAAFPEWTVLQDLMASLLEVMGPLEANVDANASESRSRDASWSVMGTAAATIRECSFAAASRGCSVSWEEMRQYGGAAGAIGVERMPLAFIRA